MSNSVPNSIIHPEPEFELVRTTNPEIINQVWRNNSSHFANTLPLDIWLEKAALRTSLDLGPGVEHVIWVLVPKGKGDDPTSILSAVHTYERPGMMSVVSTPNRNAENIVSSSEISVKDIVIVYALLVFTPTKHRKRGYARIMLKMLATRLKQQLDPVVTFSFLYSSVGPTFYESIGWPAIRSRELVLEIPNFVFPVISSSFPNTRYNLEDITEANIKGIIDHDVGILRHDLINAQASSLDECFALILPETRVFQGQLAMAKFANTRISHVNRSITRIGARLVCEEEPKTGYPFIIWTYLSSYKLLLILRTRYENVDQLQRLLKEAMKEAKDWGMTTMALWDLNEQDAVQATGVSNRDRTVAWSCINQLSEESNSAPTLRLLQNEAFVWGL
ncbi:hypothetical protein BGZ76_002133 [Entomortierella beljakovae]|nr:hypothetical protein BGZ76_002133 [Entomortierella beljakovae]